MHLVLDEGNELIGLGHHLVMYLHYWIVLGNLPLEGCELRSQVRVVVLCAMDLEHSPNAGSQQN